MCVEYDLDTHLFGVFGTESGFCYSLHASKDEALKALGPAVGGAQP